VCACCLRDWWTGYAAGYSFACMYGTLPIEVVIEVILLLVIAVLCLLCISCSFCHTFCCLCSCSSVVSPTPCLLFVDTDLFTSYTLIHACALQFLHHQVIYLWLCQQWNHEMYMKPQVAKLAYCIMAIQAHVLHANHILTDVQSTYCLPHFKSIWSLEGMLKA